MDGNSPQASNFNWLFLKLMNENGLYEREAVSFPSLEFPTWESFSDSQYFAINWVF